MTTLTIRISDDLKKDLQKMAKQMGLSLSSLVSANLTNLRRTRKLEVSAEPDWNDSNWTPSAKYLEKIKTDSDFKETVFISKKSGDTREFLGSLIDKK
jgi:antitoxin component of RelBE/YafQ-DinJ toxin-antitoxin module